MTHVIEQLCYVLYQFSDLERFYVSKILAELNAVMGHEIGEEIHGIADYWDIDVGIIAGLNIIYETRKVAQHYSYYTLCISCTDVRKTTL